MSKGHGTVQRRILDVLADGPATVHDVTMSYRWADQTPPQLRSIQRAMERLWQDGTIEFAHQMEHAHVYRLPGDERDLPDRTPDDKRRLVVERQYGDIVEIMVIEAVKQLVEDARAVLDGGEMDVEMSDEERERSAKITLLQDVIRLYPEVSGEDRIAMMNIIYSDPAGPLAQSLNGRRYIEQAASDSSSDSPTT